MIKIQNTVIKKQSNFWNHCLFHPTDAVEDAWGKRILDRMAEDGSVQTVRIYAMLEDIVYMDENGCLQYDFRTNDLRLDYLIEKGYDILLAYACIPDCIAASTSNKTSVSKNKTRYKGKMWNSAPPRDYALWEQVCHEYTKHIVERYGLETVSHWRLQCFNEPDIPEFFFSELPKHEEWATQKRLEEYCKLYEHFQRGIRRVSEEIKIGGPALAYKLSFLGGFLDYVKEHGLKLDFISVHNYGTTPGELNRGVKPICVNNQIERHKEYVQTVKEHGFDNIPLTVDEWGMSTSGFLNREECPALMARETEVFSAYYVKLIHSLIDADFIMDKIIICLSGQHEMVEDFSGFRNFFTLNFIAKPIYNAYILASKLGEGLLASEVENKNIFVIPTQNARGEYAVLLSYSSEYFEENLPALEETIRFAEDIGDKTVTVWCIDKETTNPYRLYQKMGIEVPGEADLKILREEGKLKPVKIQKGTEPLTLRQTSNATYLITVTE